jgi:hypothetical protein
MSLQRLYILTANTASIVDYVYRNKAKSVHVQHVAWQERLISYVRHRKADSENNKKENGVYYKFVKETGNIFINFDNEHM